MNQQRAYLNWFPVQYNPVAWLPAIVLTFGFLLLEELIHDYHPVTNPFLLFSISSWPVSIHQISEWIYRIGYLLFLTPLAIPALRITNGKVRRMFVGSAIQLIIGSASISIPILASHIDIVPCLQVANSFFIILVLNGLRHALIRTGSWISLPLIVLATLLTQRHDWTDVGIGLLLGIMAFRIAFSRNLEFLDDPHPWKGISFHLKNLRNLFIGNQYDSWESCYQSGQWKFLESIDQRPRHYAITGIVRDRFTNGADILDVGCGYGTLYRLLDQPVRSYTGIDLSESAIKKCLASFHGDQRCSFEQADFEKYEPGRKFDVIVLNEVLYYFSLKLIKQIVQRSLNLLRDENSVLIISMNKNPKAGWIWRKLSKEFIPEQSIRVNNVGTGSCWTVNVYQKTKEDLRPHNSSILTQSIQKEHAIVTVLMAGALTFGFYATDQHMALQLLKGSNFWRPSLHWDTIIPFIPSWIWIYLSYFSICFLPATFKEMWKDIGLFRRTALGFVIQFIAALTTFWLFPSQMVRPDFQPHGLSEQVLAWFYQIDSGFNIFPSLHVANVAYVACVAWFFNRRILSIVVWVMCALVGVSTLFIKQHYLIDLPAGVIVGLLGYIVAFSKAMHFLDRPQIRLPETNFKIPNIGWFSQKKVSLGWLMQVCFAMMGLSMVFWLIKKIGWQSIESSLATFGLLPMIGLILFYGFAQLSFCYGWYWSLGQWRTILGLRGIIIPFLAGDALNCSIPSANAAGEPVRVMMLKNRLPVQEGISSVTIYKFSDFVSLTLFLGFGLTVSWITLSLPSVWYWSGLIVFVGMAGFNLIALKLQSQGIYGSLFKKVLEFIEKRWAIKISEEINAIDKNVSSFFKDRPKELMLSTLFNFLGWFGGVLETYLCLYLLGLPAQWDYALAIETFALFINNVTFFIPARLGVIESSRALIFAALGLPISAGLTYGIIRRLRELIWIGLGYSLLGIYFPKSVQKTEQLLQKC